MISTFARALHVEAPRVLGRRLRPFCAYHALTLEAFGSPFHAWDRLPTCADTVEAWLICLDGYGDDMQTFRRFERSRWFRWCVRNRLLVSPWHEAADALRDYIRSYSIAPAVACSADAKRTQAPVAWHMVASVVRQGVRMADAMNMPLCELTALKVGMGEMDGLKIVERWAQEAGEAWASGESGGPSIVDRLTQAQGAT